MMRKIELPSSGASMNNLCLILHPDAGQALRIQQILFELDCHSLWVDEGGKALKIFGTMGRPRLFIFEPVLPDADGFEVLKHLRLTAGSHESPAVVFSSSPSTLQSASGMSASLGIAAVISSTSTALALKQWLAGILRIPYEGSLAWPTGKRLDPLPPVDLMKTREGMAADLMLGRMQEEAVLLRPMPAVDVLTGMVNHKAGEEAGRREDMRTRRTHRPYAVLAFEFAGQSEVFLKKAAAVIMQDIREMDVPVRWSGYRFVVILAEMGAEAARKLSERIAGKLNAAAGSPGGISIGVADSFSGEFSAVINRAESDLSRATI